MAAPTADIGGTVLRIFRELSGEVENVDLAIAATSFRAHLKDLGFKTAAAFEKDATVVNVEFNGDFYSIISTQKDPHGANLHTGSKKLAPTATEEEIGCAVLAILNNTH
jgi:predicted secreted protein